MLKTIFLEFILFAICISAPCKFHTVEDNDSCWEISRKYKVSLANIEKWNKNSPMWESIDLIFPGQNICVSPGEHPDV
jgi:LysM repeat protein